MFTKINNKSPFKIKNEDLKKGSEWNNVAKDRFVKQHGSIDDIPEGDNHFIKHTNFGPNITLPTEEETKNAVRELEQEIETLKTNS